MMQRFPLRVYYEDTDAGGVVYYANYLKFAERARTEMLRAAGISQTRLREEEGVLFVVGDVHIRYRAPARLDDELVVESEVTEVAGVRFTMAQRVLRQETLLAELIVQIIAVKPGDGDSMRPCRIPESVMKALHADSALKT